MFRFCATIIYILVSTGICINVYRKYEINYFHIFGLDYHHKIQEYKIWAIAATFAFLWAGVYYMNIIFLTLEAYNIEEEELINKDHTFKKHSWITSYDWVGLTLLLSFFIMCFNPFNCFHRVARKELAYTIWQILIAPFGKVRFRDFFFADVLTSIGGPL
jgi:hypothetical protein